MQVSTFMRSLLTALMKFYFQTLEGNTWVVWVVPCLLESMRGDGEPAAEKGMIMIVEVTKANVHSACSSYCAPSGGTLLPGRTDRRIHSGHQQDHKIHDLGK